MILEALRRLSGSSVFGSSSTQNGRPSKYGFSTRPVTDNNTDTNEDTNDETTHEPRLLSAAYDDAVGHFKASHLVKFLGSGVVSHHTDFGGCQEVMDSLKPPRKRKKCKSTALIITFTASAMITTNAGMKSQKHVCNLENIFVVHPHPTKEKWFSLISNHTSSGTLKCFCYMTLDNTTGTDVLLSFREACGIWISEKQKREESEYEWRKRNQSDSTIRDGKSNSGSGLLSESQGTSRRVSFAPTLNVLHETPNDKAMEKFKVCIDEMESSPFFVHNTCSLSSSGNLDVSLNDGFDEVSVYYSRPQLPPKAYPPPSPPVTHKKLKLVISQVVESDSSCDITLERQGLRKVTTNIGHCIDYCELEEYDFIKEESLFRNFGRSLSAPCLSCYSDQPELFTKYSQVLYRHTDAYHNIGCSSHSSSSMEGSDHEGDDIEHITNDMSSSLNNTHDSVESGAHLTQDNDCCIGDDTTTVVLLQDKCNTKDSTRVTRRMGIDNQVSVISFSQSWMSSDTNDSNPTSDECIASLSPFVCHLTDACIQVLSTLDCSTSSLFNTIMKHTMQQDQKISHPVISKQVFHDMSQLINLATYLLWNKNCQSTTSLSLEDESKAVQLLSMQQALGQHDSSTVLVLRTNESSKCVSNIHASASKEQGTCTDSKIHEYSSSKSEVQEEDLKEETIDNVQVI